jgi:hypothetical protein
MAEGAGANAASSYMDNGYLFPLDVLTIEEARRYREALEADEATYGEQFDKVYRHSPHLLAEWAWELVHNDRLLNVVEQLLGPDLMCWDTTLFAKPAHSPGYISWHQDITYWGLDEGKVCTAWVALSPSTVESGCLKVVPGTHLCDVVPHQDTFSEKNMLSRGQEVAVDVDEDKAVKVELQPGQASIHHVKIFHGSSPNRSDDRRIGFAIRYMTPEVRQAAGAKDSAILVRGSDHHGNFNLIGRPAESYAQEAIETHAAIQQKRHAILMRKL